MCRIIIFLIQWQLNHPPSMKARATCNVRKIHKGYKSILLKIWLQSTPIVQNEQNRFNYFVWASKFYFGKVFNPSQLSARLINCAGKVEQYKKKPRPDHNRSCLIIFSKQNKKQKAQITDKQANKQMHKIIFYSKCAIESQSHFRWNFITDSRLNMIMQM